MIIEQAGGADRMLLAEMAPRPVAGTEVRVRVEAAGVNPVDAGNRADPSWARVEAPFVVGYEFAGVVSEVGASVADLAAGEEVWGLLPVRDTRWGAYADEVICDATLVAARPSELDAVQAAALPLAGVTAMQLLDRLDPSAGEWMLVHGAAGGVGHLLCQLAHARGVRVAAPASVARHALLDRLSVEVVVDRHRPDAIRACCDVAGGAFPLVADLVGQGSLVASLEFAAEGARMGTIVELAGDLDEAIDRNITLSGVLMRPGRPALEALAEQVRSHGLRPVVDSVLGLAQAAQAHERVETGSGQGQLVLVP
jgi:NADPH:quinone reductase-like Zn-dependent oxidoreductase